MYSAESMTGPPAMALAGADWSSLPCDLVRRIADSFLTTNHMDCYVDLRAVCHNWRSATDDPSDASDPRFRPHRWIILDDDEALESDTRRLLVNTASGRFLHRELPLLRDYYVVATTLNGFFVLAEKSPPHAARVFNPLTGAMIRFAAPVPPDGEVAAALRFGMALPMLTLICDSSRKHYVAFSDYECFTSREYNDSSYHAPYNFARRAIRDGFDGALPGLTGLSEVVDHIGDLMRLHHAQPANFFSNHPPETGHADDGRCFLVQCSGQLLIVLKVQRVVRLLKLEPTSDQLVCLRTIGNHNHAIFIGHQRCLAVCADKFPSVEANCVYYTEHVGSFAHIYKYSLRGDKREMISAIDFVKQGKRFVPVGARPFTIIQLLLSYTINARDSQLAMAYNKSQSGALT
ncbi:hypothetical protein VPH35_055407 [Triticum aestivum]